MYPFQDNEWSIDATDGVVVESGMYRGHAGVILL